MWSDSWEAARNAAYSSRIAHRTSANGSFVSRTKQKRADKEIQSMMTRFASRRLTTKPNDRFEARIAERNRIAQGLHDTLLQGFVSASMQLHVAVAGLPATLPAKPKLSRILELMERAISEGRNAIHDLRSPRGDLPDLE